MTAELKQSRIGQMVAISTVGEKAEAFVPPLLPPIPAIQMDRLSRPLESANHALGQLDEVTSILPDALLFHSMYTNKEAVLSIQIEGTSSLSSELLDLLDLLLLDSKYENSVEGKAEFTAVFKGALDVVRYLTAMEHGLTRIRGGFPISLRLIREIHEKLLYKSKGGTKQIGEFRRSQNWIGGTRPGNAQFVPPPPGRILDLMSDLEAFIHADTPEGSPPD